MSRQNYISPATIVLSSNSSPATLLVVEDLFPVTYSLLPLLSSNELECIRKKSRPIPIAMPLNYFSPKSEYGNPLKAFRLKWTLELLSIEFTRNKQQQNHSMMRMLVYVMISEIWLCTLLTMNQLMNSMTEYRSRKLFKGYGYTFILRILRRFSLLNHALLN